MDWGTVAQWSGFAFSIFAFGVALFRRSNENVEALDRRLTVVENDIKHLPDKDGVNAMRLEISDMKGQLAVIAERVKPIAAIAVRLQETMLERQ